MWRQHMLNSAVECVICPALSEVIILEIGYPMWGYSWFSSVHTRKWKDIILRKLSQPITFLIWYPENAQFESRLWHRLYRLMIFANFPSPRTGMPSNNAQNYATITSFLIHYSLIIPPFPLHITDVIKLWFANPTRFFWFSADHGQYRQGNKFFSLSLYPDWH
jgi:hypothetical protein